MTPSYSFRNTLFYCSACLYVIAFLLLLAFKHTTLQNLLKHIDIHHSPHRFVCWVNTFNLKQLSYATHNASEIWFCFRLKMFVRLTRCVYEAYRKHMHVQSVTRTLYTVRQYGVKYVHFNRKRHCWTTAPFKKIFRSFRLLFSVQRIKPTLKLFQIKIKYLKKCLGKSEEFIYCNSESAYSEHLTHSSIEQNSRVFEENIGKHIYLFIVIRNCFVK